jgi:hypothetical protein
VLRYLIRYTLALTMEHIVSAASRCSAYLIETSHIRNFRLRHSEFRAQRSEIRAQGPRFRVQGSGFRVLLLGIRVRGSGFRVQ